MECAHHFINVTVREHGVVKTADQTCVQKAVAKIYTGENVK
jgi:hypothetical protein